MKDPGAPAGREPGEEARDLEDFGPALRISEEVLPGSEFTGRALRVDGPPDEPDETPRGRRPHRDALLAGAGIAVLFFVAAVSFWTSGAQRADSLLQALGAVLAGFGVVALLVGVFLARSD